MTPIDLDLLRESLIMAPMPPMAPRPDDSEPVHKISADLPDIESILSLNPRKKEHANVLPTAGNDH